MAKFKDGDVVEWHGKRYKVIGIVGSEMRINEIDSDGKLKRDGDYMISTSDTHAKLANAARNAKFKIGDKVRAKDPAWPGYQGHALGHDVYVVKKVDWDGTVKLDGFIDVWVSPGSLISANAVRNAKWVILYRDGGKEKIDAPTHDAAKKVADERSRKSGRGYVSVIVDDGVDYGVNSVRSRNAVVQKALNAVARNAKDAEGGVISVGDTVILADEEEYDNPKEWKVKRVDGNYVYLDDGRHEYGKDLLVYNSDRSSRSLRTTNAVVAKALNAGRVAQNADRIEEKSFGNGDVKASMKDFGRDPIYEIAVYTSGITSAVSFADKGKKCVAEARAVLSAIEKKASALKQAIAWMEQNAKAW